MVVYKKNDDNSNSNTDDNNDTTTTTTNDDNNSNDNNNHNIGFGHQGPDAGPPRPGRAKAGDAPGRRENRVLYIYLSIHVFMY